MKILNTFVINVFVTGSKLYKPLLQTEYTSECDSQFTLVLYSKQKR
jgi:hypothetical protein